MAMLAVATIYYAWRAYAQVQMQQNKLLHERVAYLLWAIAEQPD
jgi:hypothetical protein